MDDNSLPLAIFYDISAKSQEQLRRATALDVERNSHVRLRETGTWRTINASLEDHLTRVTEQTILRDNHCAYVSTQENSRNERRERRSTPVRAWSTDVGLEADFSKNVQSPATNPAPLSRPNT